MSQKLTKATDKKQLFLSSHHWSILLCLWSSWSVILLPRPNTIDYNYHKFPTLIYHYKRFCFILLTSIGRIDANIECQGDTMLIGDLTPKQSMNLTITVSLAMKAYHSIPITSPEYPTAVSTWNSCSIWKQPLLFRDSVRAAVITVSHTQ